MEQRLGIACGLKFFGRDFLKIAAVYLTIVNRCHITIPDDDVISAVLHLTAYYVRMSIFQYLILPAPCSITHMCKISVVARTRENLVEVGDIESIYATRPLYYIYTAVPNRSQSGCFPATVLERPYKSIGIVQTVRDTEATVVPKRLSR